MEATSAINLNPIVEELKSAAQDALNRGFAILACHPHEKDPWPKYSSHAVNSATFDPAIALKPWQDGHEANYGIACGKSNLTVVDCDSGLNSYEEFEAWRKVNGFPETFTVLSGREGFGAHMYYSGTMSTTAFQIAGVIGEFRSVGGYVVGAGSIHPSGKKYTILHDVEIVPLPEDIKITAKAKKKLEYTPVAQGGEKIAAGNRWIHLQALAGKLKNAGLGENGIYAGLKDFLELNCEDGENYPDEKIKALAKWGASDECKGETPAVVTVGTPDPEFDPEAENKGLEEPEISLTGDYIGDLSHELTKGTFIPPGFARSSLKSLLSPVIDGLVAFPTEKTLHMRTWNALVSSRPEMGKGVIWQRLMDSLGNQLMSKYGVVSAPSGFFSSGEHAIKILTEHDGCPHIVHFDEMRTLFEKGAGKGSTLFSRLLSLYESREGSSGSLSNDAHHFKNVSLSMTGGFTRNSFERSVAGIGAGSDGFLSRMVLCYSNGVDHVGDWEDMDVDKINASVKDIMDTVEWLRNQVGFAEHQIGATKITPYILEETEDAKELRLEFQKWFNEERKRLDAQNPDTGYGQRLESHFKRDIIFRALFTPERQITVECVRKAIEWTKYQLVLRQALWPVDFGNILVQCEQQILKAVRRHGPMSKAVIQRYSHIERAAGGYDAWNRAWSNLLKAEALMVHQTYKYGGKILEKWGIRDAIWDKKKGVWI